MRLIVDGTPIPYQPGDKLLTAMLRNNIHPTGGGCLCTGGDCPHCLATVDGVSYVRTCQVHASPGMIVARDHTAGYPPLPEGNVYPEEVASRNLHCDVAVIGQGESGQAAATTAMAAGKKVITLDVDQGQEAIGIYNGPLVVARANGEMWYIHVKEEVIVATGAAEIHPVAPGNGLAGIYTARAAENLARAGIDLGKVISVGTAPNYVWHEHVSGRIMRFEGTDGKVSSVVVNDGATDQTYACDSVVVGLGFHPRDALRRMGHDLPVRAVGDAARESDIPPCPLAGTVCTCSGIGVEELDYIWDHGFHEMELVKRGTLAGTGTCQGSVCLPHLRSYLQDRGQELQPPFTARPLTRQVTLGEISAGAHHHAMAESALHDEHLKAGAQMERFGHWWRPWTYGDWQAEYWAVREAVSIMDVGTLGKIVVSGPDALPFLEKIYPTDIASIRTGRSRYVLLLDERGFVMDDGLVCKESDTRYILSLTSGGSSHSEMWLRDWAASGPYDVRIINQTMSLGAINVTGPYTNELLKRAGLEKPMRFMRHGKATIAGVDCHVFRLSFTGETSYELHHPLKDSVKLWRALLDLGQDLGIKPHGLEALTRLRLEKGHIIIGQDTDLDSTPRRIHHDWMVKMNKGADFIGRQALLRTNAIELDKMLVGFEMDTREEPNEGDTIWVGEEYVGYITSRTYSPILDKSVMLGWLFYQDGELPTDVTIKGRPAKRVDVPFYDKEAARARA